MKPTFRRRTLQILCVIFITLTTIIACSRSFFDKAPEIQLNKTFRQFEVDYQSTFRDSTLHFELELLPKGKASAMVHETFDINLKGKKYLKTIYQTLQKRSLQDQYRNLTVEQAREMCFSLRLAIDDYTKSCTPEEHKSPKVQGMYMGLSFLRRILKNKLEKTPLLSVAVARNSVSDDDEDPTDPDPDIEDQPPFEQEVYEGYSRGMSAFALNEDIIVNKQAFLNIVNDDIAEVSEDDQGLYVFQEVLNSVSATTLTLKDLLGEMDSYVDAQPENAGDAGWWPSGSSHGCCGNYSGICWYWHPLCYLHDVMCGNCKPRWFCLSGCVPDTENTSEETPFTFIEGELPDDGPGVTLIPAIPPFQGVYYKLTESELPSPLPQLFTTIYLNPANNKYYSDQAYTTFVPTGYYDSPNEINGDYHKYYYIANGLVYNITGVYFNDPE